MKRQPTGTAVRYLLMWGAILAIAGGCARDLGITTKNFQCETHNDCVDGFICPPQLKVCARPCQQSEDCPSGYCEPSLKICVELSGGIDATTCT